MHNSIIYDYIVIGSGFGGAVSAMRLSQKGYKVLVLEKGKEYSNKDFPKTNWNIKKYLWAPLIRCFGVQAITVLNKVMVLHGIGVGGGSLVYANTLMTPPDEVFSKADWPKGFNWHSELLPHYQTARKMLGVTDNKFPAEEGELALKEVAAKMGKLDTFHATEVGIFFGEQGKTVKDPYFNGEGPDRTGCDACGACMIGCPNGAKNTLDKNYLFFAKKYGASIIPERKVTKLTKTHDENGEIWNVSTKITTSYFGKCGGVFQARNVVLSGGALGTLELLFKNRDIYGTLPLLSGLVGEKVRTNNESLLGATCLDTSRNFSKGTAIGAAFHPDEQTKIENVRYPKGADLLRFMAVPLCGAGNPIVRLGKMFITFFKNFFGYMRQFLMRDWANGTTILLFMQSHEGHLRLAMKRSLALFGTPILKAIGPGVQSYYPEAQEAAKNLAQVVGGVPSNVISEVVLGIPATAHILGGAVMGNNAQEGVIDTNHQVFGHKGLYVCDASVIPCNLAVNPSLTITALAERFCSLIPEKKS